MLWTNLHTYIPQKQLVFTEKELLQYDGSNPNLPIYLAVDGDVFDVTKGRGWYGYGASYGHFSGKDAARAFVTGCFEDHLTHDLRGLSAAQLKGVEHWKSFYTNHHTYHKIGTVIHPPLDENTPIPPPYTAKPDCCENGSACPPEDCVCCKDVQQDTNSDGTQYQDRTCQRVGCACGPSCQCAFDETKEDGCGCTG
ncbi:unnamed protein product [Absidia cylindrospora]